MLIRALPLLTLLGCGAPPPAWEGEGPSTVVVLVACTMRADRLGLYGNPHEPSPTLDRLGAEGAVFERMISNAPWTRPAVGALITGRYPLVLGLDDPADRGLTNRGVHPDFATLAEAFHAAGWGTVGATANPNANAAFGMAQGFDTYHEATGLWREDMRKVGGDEVVDMLLASLEQTPGRVYAQLVVVDTHQPLPRRLWPRLRWGWQALTEPSLLDLYDVGVTVLDQTVRRLEAGLERLGRGDRLLLFVGDHGEGLLHPIHAGRAHGRHLYDANLRVPWLVHGPGVHPGRIGGLAESVDLAPTVLELAGVPALGPLDGDSRAAQVRGDQAQTGERAVFAETWYLREHKARWTTDALTYIWDYKAKARGQGRGESLFMAQDVQQGRDVFTAHVAEARAMQAELEALRERLMPQQQVFVLDAVDAAVTRQLQQLGYVVEEEEGADER